MHARVVWGPSLDQERAVSETQMVVILASTELHKLYAKSKTPANVLYENRVQQFKLKAVWTALFRTVIVIRRLLISGCPNASPREVFGTNGNIQSGQLATIDQSGTNYSQVHAVHAQIKPCTVHACDMRVHA